MTTFFTVFPVASATWYVSNIRDELSTIDVRVFVEGVDFVVHGRTYFATIEHPGEQSDLTFSDFDVVITSIDLADELQEMDGKENIQIVPIKIDGAFGNYCIANVVNNVDCFDYNRSTYTTWGEQDGRADKIGELRMVLDLVIDPARTAGRNIFRVSGWPAALIVSDQARDVIQKRVHSGIAFWPVTP